MFLYGRGLYSVELVDWKGFGTKRRWPDSRYCPAICWKELSKTADDLTIACFPAVTEPSTEYKSL